MIAKFAMAVLMCASALLTTGCWNKLEISDLAIVSAIGVDKAQDIGEYRVFFQVANPSAVASGAAAGGGGGAGAGGKAQTITVYRGVGASLFDAVRNASKMSSRRMYLSHVRLVVFGERLAKDGIEELLDYLKRSNEIRLTTNVVIAKGMTAEALMSVATRFEKIPADAIRGKMKFTSNLFSENIEIQLDDILKAVMGEGTEAVINGVELVKRGDKEAESDAPKEKERYSPPSTKIGPIGVFKGGKLKLWLDDGASRGLAWMLNKMKGTVVTVDFREQKESVSLDVLRSKTKVKVDVANDKPLIDIVIRQEAALINVKSGLDLRNPGLIKEIEASMNRKTREEIMKTVQIVKKEKIDFAGFAGKLHRSNRTAWEKLKDRWNEKLSEADVRVTVQSHVRHPGMNLEPVLSKATGEQ
ncbi:Ger(x)C family spore germination protein [Paenibacillus sp. GYB003]|uniref:Ger(x)C family spore germination protein n=1 Tax=Paenibacillus sp. GYB003 TaxID=2994392 RepID=UPI002F960A31